MKKIILILAICLGLTSCSTPFIINTKGYTTGQHMELDEAWKYVSSFNYYSDEELYGVKNYWASPNEFFENGGGDCEDFCIALMYEIGGGALIIMEKDDGSYHAIVYYNHKYLEPQTYDKHYSEEYITSREKKAYSYDDVMEEATYLGTKALNTK